MNVLLILGVVALAAVVVVFAAFLGYALMSSSPDRRQSRALAEHLAAEARIDFLTRQTIQQMRDAVRTEARDRLRSRGR